MKKLSILLFTIILSATVFAGYKIDPKGLPKAASKFIKDNFAAETVVYAEQDLNEFDVYLSNGVEIQFTGAGEWKEVDGNYTALPETFIPASVVKSIKAMYPDAKIVKIDKEYSGYDIQLNNRMELYVDNAGKILKAKYDD